ncbi:FUSC family protein [Gordonia sp. (in: high G+C Gram-positive bacteria)]|uniref:FUSC family protein n=1 Tax=Gordonia sp. (in: high G+C Gram-positive bacteria) TaxID=84139 RepID=UPI0039E50667
MRAREPGSRALRRFPPPVQRRIRRLLNSAVPILQCAVAAAAAWWIATEVFSHHSPFFAPIAAIISLGLSLSKRWRRSAELVAGVTIGVLIGDFLVRQFGSGAWQIAVAVLIAMSLAVFVDNGPIIPMQAASSAVLVVALPVTGAGFTRAVDALIGGIVGILIVVILPTNPAHRARLDAARILATERDACARLAAAIRADDAGAISDVHRQISGLRGNLDEMRTDMRAGREVSVMSPLYWGSRARIARIAATAEPIDAAVRNLQVLTRRIDGMATRGEPVPEPVVELIAQLADGYEILRAFMLAPPTGAPDAADAARVLRGIVRQARPELVAAEDVTAASTLAQIRSQLVDMMMIAGLSRTTAVAQLHRGS